MTQELGVEASLHHRSMAKQTQARALLNGEEPLEVTEHRGPFIRIEDQEEEVEITDVI